MCSNTRNVVDDYMECRNGGVYSVTGRFNKFWSEWRSFVVFVVVMLIFRSAIADWNQVPSGSMKPSFFGLTLNPSMALQTLGVSMCLSASMVSFLMVWYKAPPP